MKHFKLPFNYALSIGSMNDILGYKSNKQIYFGIIFPPSKYGIKGISLVIFKFMIGVHTRID